MEENQEEQREELEPVWKRALKWVASAVVLLVVLALFVWGVDWVIELVKGWITG